MGEVFNLPLEYAGACYQDQEGYCFGGNDIHKDSAAVHAVNCHDAMLEALELMVKHFSNEDETVRCMDNNILHYADQVITKSRGERL